MLKHVLQYLLITAGFVAIPFVLYFAVTVFSDVTTEVEQEQNTQQVTASPSPSPSPELPRKQVLSTTLACNSPGAGRREGCGKPKYMGTR